MNNVKQKTEINLINDIQNEILRLGWNGILKKYHPENNIDDPDANDIFRLYKNIYENMKQRLTLE